MKKGLWYAVIASLLLASHKLFAQHFLEYVNPATANTLWFGAVFVISSLFLLKMHAFNSKEILVSYGRHWKDGLIVGGLNAIAATLVYNAINLIGPATTSFLLRISMIFIVILGVVFLKERLHFHDLVGFALAIIGTIVISISDGHYFGLGVAIAIIATVAIALHQFFAKIFVAKIAPMKLVNIRTLFSSSLLLLFALVTRSFEPSKLPWQQFMLLLIGGAISVIGFYFFYKALEAAEVSKGAVIRSLDPFVVVIYSFLIYHGAPTAQEILGGSLIVLGVVAMTSHRGLISIISRVKNLVLPD